MENDYPCPCCGYLVFDEAPGSYDICPICYWEDDLAQLRFAAMSWGANRTSLVQAQVNFASLGVSEERLKNFVRAVAPSDRRDPLWRPVDAGRGDVEEATSGRDYGSDYPEDSASLYYWRDTYWRRS